MKVAILSFSYKRGLPEDKTGNGGGFVFDCRAMPNPYWEESLRGYTGRDKPVVDFFARFPGKVERFLGVKGSDTSVYVLLYMLDGIIISLPNGLRIRPLRVPTTRGVVGRPSGASAERCGSIRRR